MEDSQTSFIQYEKILYLKGHVGYLIICALEMKKIGKKVMAWFFFIGSLY